VGVRLLAEGRLCGSGYAVLRDVRCEYERGVLRLSGRVASYYLKQVAQQTVADVDGMQSIINQIEVSACANAESSGPRPGSSLRLAAPRRSD
jgi:osmotically-inducible protein OsmY